MSEASTRVHELTLRFKDRPEQLRQYGAEGYTGPEIDAALRDLGGAADPPDQATGSDWQPVDLYRLMDESRERPTPSQLERTDGAPLIEQGSIIAIIGESGTGKSKLCAAFGLQQVRAGEGVAIFDFEDSAVAYLDTLETLGFERSEILSNVRYFNPYKSFDESALAEVKAALTPAPSLVVFDAATEAMAATIPGASSNSADDWSRFVNEVVRPIRDHTGATIVLIDHPVKNRDNRNGYAAGTQHKRASVDVALTLEPSEPFGRGVSGEALLKVAKDRRGHLLALANKSSIVGVVKYAARQDGSLRVSIDPPADNLGAFRPTYLMERVSQFVEVNQGTSVREIRASVKGNTQAISAAITVLIAEGYIECKQDGRSRVHSSARPYREADDES